MGLAIVGNSDREVKHSTPLQYGYEAPHEWAWKRLIRLSDRLTLVYIVELGICQPNREHSRSPVVTCPFLFGFKFNYTCQGDHRGHLVENSAEQTAHDLQHEARRDTMGLRGDHCVIHSKSPGRRTSRRITRIHVLVILCRVLLEWPIVSQRAFRVID